MKFVVDGTSEGVLLIFCLERVESDSHSIYLFCCVLCVDEEMTNTMTMRTSSNEVCETTIQNNNNNNNIVKKDESELALRWNGASIQQHECSSFQCQTIFKQLIEQHTHFNQVAKEKEKLQVALNDLSKRYEETKCALKVIYQGTKTTFLDLNYTNRTKKHNNKKE